MASDWNLRLTCNAPKRDDRDFENGYLWRTSRFFFFFGMVSLCHNVVCGICVGWKIVPRIGYLCIMRSKSITYWANLHINRRCNKRISLICTSIYTYYMMNRGLRPSNIVLWKRILIPPICHVTAASHLVYWSNGAKDYFNEHINNLLV